MATTLTRDQADFLSWPGQTQPTMASMTDYYRLMADQIAGAERRWPQQQPFNTYYLTQLPKWSGQ
jgi:hypothetical protein